MSEKKPIIMQELGVLLKPDHEEYGQYSRIYDKKHGYYDESQQFMYGSEFEQAKAEAKKYVAEGVEGTYAVITSQGMAAGPLDKLDISSAGRRAEDVIYSIAKVGGEIITLIA